MPPLYGGLVLVRSQMIDSSTTHISTCCVLCQEKINLDICTFVTVALVTIPAAEQLLDDSRQQLPAVESCQTRPQLPVTAARTQLLWS